MAMKLAENCQMGRKRQELGVTGVYLRKACLQTGVPGLLLPCLGCLRLLLRTSHPVSSRLRQHQCSNQQPKTANEAVP